MRGLVLAMGVAWVFLAGCNSFQSRWNAAPAAPAGGVGAGGQIDLAGRWEGTWTSELTDHSGPARCVFQRSGKGEYQAVFEARNPQGLIFETTVELRAKPLEKSPWKVALLGKKEQAWYEGGRFYFTGDSDGKTLFMNYQGKLDRGRFELKRAK